MNMSGILYEKPNGSPVDILSRENHAPHVKNKHNVQAGTDCQSRGANPNAPTKTQTGPFYKTFTIGFYYSRQFHQLKVMKVTRHYDSPIYKVVFSSALKSNGLVCWLQQQKSNTWCLVLGNGINEKLIAAISAAIEFHE